MKAPSASVSLVVWETSYGHAEQKLNDLEMEIKELLAKAEQADSTPLQDGLTIPDEVQRREERQAALRRAKVEMEARAYARFQAESAQYEAKVAAREALVDSGKKPRGRAPEAPSALQVETADSGAHLWNHKGSYSPNTPTLFAC